jgi:hypothetical protein
VTAKRRVEALESSLRPLDVAHHVIAEDREFASLDAYARAIADVPVEAAPMSRIAEQSEASVRSAAKGQPRDDVEAAVRRAVGDAIFRYILFLRMNTAALELAEREGLRATVMTFCMGCLLGGPREHDLTPEDWRAHQAEQANAWRVWRGVVGSLLLLVMVEDDARDQLEARYLGGQPALLAESQAEWDRFADLVDRLSSMSTNLARDDHDGEERALAEAEHHYFERVAARAQWLADEARVATFERLGEMPRAVAIMERRVRSPG